ADVSLVERDGLGGSTVLTDCVPSKTLIATAEVITQVREAGELGVRVDDAQPHESGIRVDNAVVNARIKALAKAQSADTRDKVVGQGVRVIDGVARFEGPDRVLVEHTDGGRQVLPADVVLIATGARPRI